jgi:hypothetical protein
MGVLFVCVLRDGWMDRCVGGDVGGGGWVDGKVCGMGVAPLRHLRKKKGRRC